MIKVSVLVPIYNVEKYLGQCLESLCKQTLQEIEIICINDGSTDRSKEILEEYQKQDNRIVVIEKPNTGYGNSMNIGLDRAVGKYIAIVESDDFIETDMMEQLYVEAEKTKADLVKSNCYFYLDHPTEEHKFINIFDELPTRELICPIKRPKLFLKLQAIWSGLYRREFLVKNQIRFHETPGASYQDVSFSFQVYACASKVWLVPEAYYHYRTSNLNSSVKAPNKIFCICEELEKINQWIEERGKEEETLKRIASRLGYRVLLESYHSLASAFQYTLFLRMVEYFKGYQASGYMGDPIWDLPAVEEVETILKNPNQYFMETAKSFEDKRIRDKNSPALNYSLYGQAVLKKVLESKQIIIYGAGQIGKEFLGYLLENKYRKNDICFAVTDKKENQSDIEGIPVLEIEKCQEWKEEAMVAVAVKEQSQFEILQRLERMSFKKIVAIDQLIRHAIKEGIKIIL
ncbi:MAG: glycosyltransferase [Lachnospiraceae bacterium]|nr:glycosyltransferase [Lachnospiraceae bacterium]